MDEHKNLPAKLASQELAATTEKRGSLMARGLAAVLANTQQPLAMDNDALYRQAREVYNQLTNDGFSSWCGDDEQKLLLAGALNTFLQLAAKGYGKAYFPLSTLFSGKQSVKGDPEQAERYRKLAYDWLSVNQYLNEPEIWHDLGAIKSCGDPHYLWLIGEMYYNGFKSKDRSPYVVGEVIEQNYEEAEYWYRKSAEMGDCYFQWQLGELYSEGRGVTQNYEQAAYWFNKAAEQMDDERQCTLGSMYQEGLGVEQNDEQAVYWFYQAAEQGNAMGAWLHV